MLKKTKVFDFFGIKFYNSSYNFIINKIYEEGGYLCAPAAYPLYRILDKKDYKYYNALKNANINLFDSGYFCILLKFFLKIKIKKFSGYKFISKLIKDKKLKEKKILLINPSIKDEECNIRLFKKKNFKFIYSYLAPFYRSSSSFFDRNLFKKINKIKPRIIIINISGLKQENLAFMIQQNIKFKLSIFCLGGAISFITGTQAPINSFFDKYYLGWFIRIIHRPDRFILRTIKSILLVKLVIKHKYKSVF
jgi:UDP-N-acetyl-D-mannosaminuronic acid transferase (WecB/TagA/CpsF family)